MTTAGGSAGAWSSRASALAAEGTPFVHATVVRAQAPTPARPGDDAVVLADGTIEGFVGGQCAEESVRTAALDALAAGEPLLLRVLPEGGGAFPDVRGSRVVVNPCLSGGALEIFLEPHLPAPRVAVVGRTPVALALGDVAERLGLAVETAPVLTAEAAAGVSAVVVATCGHDEAESVRAALDAGIGFVGLVASRRRGAAVLDAMGLGAEERARVRTPVGLDIGARTAPEIAVSIAAQLVQVARAGALVPAGGGAPVAAVRAVDPVCGMTVVVGPDTPHRVVGGDDVWFCSPACRDGHAA